jgi:hemolysin D
MEPTDKSSLSRFLGKFLPGKRAKAQAEIAFLPDADEMERAPLPALARQTIHILVLLLVSFVLWASFSKVEKVVVAHGRLVNPAPNVVLQPLETAIIRKIEVRPGQVVKKGDVLATLDPTFAQADEAQLRSRLETLELQAQSLRAELDGTEARVVIEGATLPPTLPLPAKAGKDGKDPGKERAKESGTKTAVTPGTDKNTSDRQIQNSLSLERQANYRAQRIKGEENLARVQASLETNLRDQQVLAARLRTVREIESMQEKLVANQYGARQRLLEAQDKRLEIERDMLLTRNRETEIRSELASLEADGQAFDKGWRQKLTEELLATTREIGTVNEQLAKANLRYKLVVMTSPLDAVVLEIAKLSPGSVVREAETFFTLVPIGGNLEAEVQIDSLDVGYIKTGDVAHIKLDAFPFQKHGALDAKIRSISEDAFRRDSQAGTGLDAYYVSRLSIANPRLKLMGERTRLLPGMTVNAEIVVGKRSVMSYLIWPLTKALDESIREP